MEPTSFVGSPTPISGWIYDSFAGWGYGQRANFAHFSTYWTVPYMRTGREVYLDILTQATALGLATNPACYGAGNRNFTYNGKKYWNIYFLAGGQQVRQRGWFHLSTARLEYMLPANDPFRAYLKDLHDDLSECAGFWPALINSISPNAAKVDGTINREEVNVIYVPWMISYEIAALAMDAWRDDRRTLQSLSRYHAKLFTAYWDDTRGGSSYYADDYGENVIETTGGVNNKDIRLCLGSVAAIMAANHRSAGQPARNLYATYNGDANHEFAPGMTIGTGQNFEKRLCALSILLAYGNKDARAQFDQILHRLGWAKRDYMFEYNTGSGAAPQWAIVPPG